MKTMAKNVYRKCTENQTTDAPTVYFTSGEQEKLKNKYLHNSKTDAIFVINRRKM